MATHELPQEVSLVDRLAERMGPRVDTITAATVEQANANGTEKPRNGHAVQLEPGQPVTLNGSRPSTEGVSLRDLLNASAVALGDKLTGVTARADARRTVSAGMRSRGGIKPIGA